MNVSFGRLNYEHSMIPNRKQQKVLMTIDKELNPDWVEILGKKSKPKHCNITNLLEIEKDADIRVHLKENGKIDINVEKDLPSIDISKKYTPFSNLDNSQLKITIDPNRKQATILKKIRDFAEKCYWYAKSAETRKNTLIEQNAELRLEKRLAEMDVNVPELV